VNILIDILSYFNYLGTSLDEYFYLIDSKYYATVGTEDKLVTSITISDEGLFFTDQFSQLHQYLNGSFNRIMKNTVTGYRIAPDEHNRWHLRYGQTNVEIGTVERGLTQTFASKFKEGLIT